MDRLGLAKDHVFCSEIIVLGDRIAQVSEVFGPEQKAELVRRLAASGSRIVAVGDGANDIEMCRAADIGIAFGGAREVPEGLREVCGRIFNDDRECAEYLRTLI